MEHIIKKINMIDILGMLLPGGLMLLLLEQDVHWMKELLDYWGAKADNLLFIMIYLCGSYGVGMLLHEMGSIIEKLMWKVPLFNPSVWAAVETKLADRYNEDGTLRVLPKEEKTVKNENQDDDQKMANHNSAQKTKNGEEKVEVKKKPSVCAKGYMAIPALLVGIVGLGIFPLGINLYVSIWVILCVCACVWVIVDRNRENMKKVLHAYTQDTTINRLKWIDNDKLTIESESHINEEHSRKRGLFNGYYTMARSLIMMMALLQFYAWLQSNDKSSFMMLIAKINNNPAYLFLWEIVALLLMSRYWHFACARFTYAYNGFIHNKENPAKYKIVEQTRETAFEDGRQKSDIERIKWMKK